MSARVCVLQNSGSQRNEGELRDRISIRSNVTAALTSLNISSVKEVAQLSAALQQCVVRPGSCPWPGYAIWSLPPWSQAGSLL